MNAVPRFTLRQILESLPLIFDPQACPGLNASIQFNVSGAEPGVYSLQIANDDCVFHTGACPQPTLNISTPSDVWLKIMGGQLSGQEALTNGLYTVQGDPTPIQNWGKLFKLAGNKDFKASPDQRPAGPLPISGSAWMAIAFIPWIFNWVTFGSFGLSPFVSLGLPLLLSGLIVAYRLVYNRPGWLELGGAAFFALGDLLLVFGVQAFVAWGSILSNLAIGMLWLASLFTAESLSKQYIKWGFDRKLWSFSLFNHINAAISLVWGCQSLLAAFLGAVALLYPSMNGLFTVLRYATLVPAYYFTGWYPKAGMQTPVKDIDRAQKGIRVAASIIIFLGIALLAFIGQFFR